MSEITCPRRGLKIQNVFKTYWMGDTEVKALQGVSLTIEEGDFIAIMGPSGSGKSTLMHMLGLLDQPDSGSYQLEGREVSKLNDQDLALLRRESIGFIFQQFHLLPRLSALENVALPALYAQGKPNLAHAHSLLKSVGLENRADHRPNELSGGQQQRVSIARSLMNDPKIILADEPTGNLDSKSKQEILNILKELNAQGITVVIVTHEEEIGSQAKRILRMNDGKIISDTRLPNDILNNSPLPPLKLRGGGYFGRGQALWQQMILGFRNLMSNKVRSALSMLGILIGVAAVVAMLALGRGAQKAIEAQLSSLGSNLLVLRPGAIRVGGVALDAGAVTRLTLDDVKAIEEKISDIHQVSPSVSGRGQTAYGDKNWNTQVMGVAPAYATMHAAEPTEGRFFTEEDNLHRRLVAVIGTTVARQLFGDNDPLGEILRINKVAFRIIGILPEKGSNSFRDQDDVIIIPILTAMNRLLGKDYVDSVDIEANSAEGLDSIQDEVTAMMIARHHVPPSQQQDAFQVRNLSEIKEALSESNRIMSFLLAAIAAISLLVGGIGIMNIMLVSVTERTKEIGLRKAIGARREDILFQFLVEAVVISAVGGLAGIFLGWVVTLAMSLLAGWTTSISLDAVAISFFFSTFIGILFGLYPAKRASQLNPITALRYE